MILAYGGGLSNGPALGITAALGLTRGLTSLLQRGQANQHTDAGGGYHSSFRDAVGGRLCAGEEGHARRSRGDATARLGCNGPQVIFRQTGSPKKGDVERHFLRSQCVTKIDSAICKVMATLE